MSKGRTLSYWADKIPSEGEQVALYIRNTTDDEWMLVGIYEKDHLYSILRTTYANWPKGTVYTHQLP